jgi:hydroxylysine kinase
MPPADSVQPADLARVMPAAPVPPAEAARVLRHGFELAGDLERLPGEADENFLLRTADGTRYMAKFAHPLTDPDVLDTQARVLRYLRSAAPELPVQRVLPARDGGLCLRAANGRLVMVTSYLSGKPLRDIETTAGLRRHLGGTLAALARALRGFGEPVRPRPLLWDIAQLPLLRPLAADLPSGASTGLLLDLLDNFEERVTPWLARQRRQLVHNDFHMDNVLISDDGTTVAGILDFGDMTVTALANDVAIAAAYQLSTASDLLGPALDLIAGYHAVTPLTSGEQDLLPDLIQARLVARVIISQWRGARFPENEEYILRSTPGAWAHLSRLRAIPAAQAAERVRSVCQQGSSHA